MKTNRILRNAVGFASRVLAFGILMPAVNAQAEINPISTTSFTTIQRAIDGADLSLSSIELSKERSCESEKVLTYVQYKESRYGRFSFLQDGSEQRPFSTLQAALREGVEKKACSLEIVILKPDSTYFNRLSNQFPGDLLITRTTRIIADAAHVPTIVGTVNNPFGHTLSIYGVNISSAKHNAVYQLGGTLEMADVTIRNTKQRDADTIPQGAAAISLKAGANARLYGVHIIDNETQGILVEGSDTKLEAKVLTIANNAVPFTVDSSEELFQGNFAALEITDGALALLENLYMDENRYTAAYITNGAKAHLRYSTILNTRSTEMVNGRAWGGANLLIRDQAQVEATYVATIGGELAGIIISNAYANFRSPSYTAENLFGLALLNSVEDWDFAYCLEGLRFDSNEVNFQSDSITVPSAADALCDAGIGECDEQNASPVCPEVPW